VAEEDGRRDVAEQPEDDELEGQKTFFIFVTDAAPE
jgi:hypothetical protein